LSPLPLLLLLLLLPPLLIRSATVQCLPDPVQLWHQHSICHAAQRPHQRHTFRTQPTHPTLASLPFLLLLLLLLLCMLSLLLLLLLLRGRFCQKSCRCCCWRRFQWCAWLQQVLMHRALPTAARPMLQ
jgi:hypothetical protein